MTFSRIRLSTTTIALLLAAFVLGPSSDATATAVAPRAATTPDPLWSWPVPGRRSVLEPFRAPAHEYGPGHRGMDVAAGPGAIVRAPAAGIIAFRGTVVDRPLLTIDTGSGWVITAEPVASDLNPGDVVAAGEQIGVLAVGGHAPPTALHLGVRWQGEYVNPMPFFGGVRRAVLLPCCGPL